MKSATKIEKHDNYKINIASGVRNLRKARRWTQRELASRIGLSQNRLSEIERGAGSFTAEQFLVILKLFNVPVSHFAPNQAGRDVELQNALARFGAHHLHESDDVLPDERSGDVTDVIREALLSGAPRLITALGPVIVRNINLINWRRLESLLADVGLQHRLAWLVENILDAVRREQAPSLPRRWTRRCRRAEIVLGSYLGSSAARLQRSLDSPDILDAEIRSQRTLQRVTRSASPISQRWGIITTLHPEDFSTALGAARDDP